MVQLVVINIGLGDQENERKNYCDNKIKCNKQCHSSYSHKVEENPSVTDCN